MSSSMIEGVKEYFIHHPEHLRKVVFLEDTLKTLNYSLKYPLWIAGAAFALTKGLELLVLNSFISSKIPDSEVKNKAAVFQYNFAHTLGPINALSKVILCMGILSHTASFGIDLCKRNILNMN